MIDIDKLTCQQVVELVTDYLEQTLSPQLRKRLEEHLAMCPGCETYFDQIKTTTILVQTLGQETMFPETKQELLEIFRQWKQEK